VDEGDKVATPAHDDASAAEEETFVLVTNRKSSLTIDVGETV